MSGGDSKVAISSCKSCISTKIVAHPVTLVFCAPFVPEIHGLDSKFKLTDYSFSKGCTCNIVSQDAGISNQEHLNLNIDSNISFRGACSVSSLKFERQILIQSSNSIYPIIDDPYIMGKIACAHVLSNVYALGVRTIDNLLILVCLSNKMTKKERDVILPIILRGFKDSVQEAGSLVTGGQIMVNRWFRVGAVISSVSTAGEYILPCNAVEGDVLVLTKPLGTQVAVTAYRWLHEPDRWNRLKDILTTKEVNRTYRFVITVMARLNRYAAWLMNLYDAHAAVAITDLGLLGHAAQLAAQQNKNVSLIIHNIPIITHMKAVNKASGNVFRLLEGKCAETSGGLLICMPREKAAEYIQIIQKQEGSASWIIGVVEKGNRTAKIKENAQVIEVSPNF